MAVILATGMGGAAGDRATRPSWPGRQRASWGWAAPAGRAPNLTRPASPARSDRACRDRRDYRPVGRSARVTSQSLANPQMDRSGRARETHKRDRAVAVSRRANDCSTALEAAEASRHPMWRKDIRLLQLTLAISTMKFRSKQHAAQRARRTCNHRPLSRSRIARASASCA
jgi:hypothetical protein